MERDEEGHPIDPARRDLAAEGDLHIAEPGSHYQFEPLSGQVIGAALAVHGQLGPGFREELYENALCIEMDRRGIPYARQLDIPVHYEGQLVGTHTLDLLVGGSIVLELKSVAVLADVHYAQLQAYLQAASIGVGLLLNFGAHPLVIKRLVNKHAQ